MAKVKGSKVLTINGTHEILDTKDKTAFNVDYNNRGRKQLHPVCSK